MALLKAGGRWQLPQGGICHFWANGVVCPCVHHPLLSPPHSPPHSPWASPASGASAITETGGEEQSDLAPRPPVPLAARSDRRNSPIRNLALRARRARFDSPPGPAFACVLRLQELAHLHHQSLCPPPPDVYLNFGPCSWLCTLAALVLVPGPPPPSPLRFGRHNSPIRTANPLPHPRRMSTCVLDPVAGSMRSPWLHALASRVLAPGPPPPSPPHPCRRNSPIRTADPRRISTSILDPVAGFARSPRAFWLPATPAFAHALLLPQLVHSHRQAFGPPHRISASILCPVAGSARLKCAFWLPARSHLSSPAPGAGIHPIIPLISYLTHTASLP
ncbi:hypothetical protein B0H19DRAFT_1247373 [Mycena capillaripes]|nr:hypothetical protein B0H19DRAFT_1247373 [Mycena capillaripes]